MVGSSYTEIVAVSFYLVEDMYFPQGVLSPLMHVYTTHVHTDTHTHAFQVLLVVRKLPT